MRFRVTWYSTPIITMTTSTLPWQQAIYLRNDLNIPCVPSVHHCEQSNHCWTDVTIIITLVKECSYRNHCFDNMVVGMNIESLSSLSTISELIPWSTLTVRMIKYLETGVNSNFLSHLTSPMLVILLPLTGKRERVCNEDEEEDRERRCVTVLVIPG